MFILRILTMLRVTKGTDMVNNRFIKEQHRQGYLYGMIIVSLYIISEVRRNK